MKKITLVEAATQVVLGLPQEDLHEGLDRNMKKVLSFLENYVKSKEPLGDNSEVEEMIELCTQEIEGNESSTDWFSAMQSLRHAQWAILYTALDDSRLYDPKKQNAVVAHVKTMLSVFKGVEKLKARA